SDLPGDKAHFAIAFAVLEGVTPDGTLEKKGPGAQATTLPELEALATKLHREYYETNFQTSSVRDWEASTLAAQIWPNPAKDQATVRMNLNERSDVSIQIVDNLGRTLRTQQQGNVEAGEKAFQLDFAGLQNGSYLVVVEAGTERQTLRVNVVE
ncbi:MAG: T9SS type A sorting domain-containing protein, partial [Candidatus Kapaibacterium sp.]